MLNFSEWDRYDPARRAAALSAIAAAAAGSMPPADYTFFDHAARLTPEERHRLTGWASAQAASIPAH